MAYRNPKKMTTGAISNALYRLDRNPMTSIQLKRRKALSDELHARLDSENLNRVASDLFQGLTLEQTRIVKEQPYKRVDMIEYLRMECAFTQDDAILVTDWLIRLNTSEEQQPDHKLRIELTKDDTYGTPRTLTPDEISEAETILRVMRDAQTTLWEESFKLERLLNFDIDTTDDLEDETIETLIERNS
jgi:hypothetical protein